MGRCLDSVKGVADETILVDTGSSDRTREIAREHGATVLEQPWADDFAAPRNLAAEHAHGDWLLVLDADEVLAPGSGPLVRLACEQGGVVAWDLPVLNSASNTLSPEEVVAKARGVTTPVQRLVKAGTRWKHRIHEIPDLPPGSPIGRLNAPIVHYGYAKDSPAIGRKTNRNLEILKAEHEEHPEDVYTAGFLVGEYLARYERQFDAWAKGGTTPDQTLLVKAAKVIDQALPHARVSTDSYRLLANRGLLGMDLEDDEECEYAAALGERVQAGHPDWAYLRGVAALYRAMQTRGEERREHRAAARRELREAQHRMDRLTTAVVLASSEEKIATALERVNRLPEVVPSP